MWILLIQVMIPNIMDSYHTGEKFIWKLASLIWPFKLWIFIGILLFVIQGLLEFLKDIIRLVKGDDAI